jgi:hypothetical protein
MGARGPRVNTEVTEQFRLRLEQAVEERRATSLTRVTMGEVLSDLAEFLPPHPDEEVATSKHTKRHKAK